MRLNKALLIATLGFLGQVPYAVVGPVLPPQMARRGVS